MGLSVEVGMLADLRENDADGVEPLKKQFAKVNAVLADNDLPAHHEPETLPPLATRSSLVSYPTSFLHNLRRFYIHAKNNPDWQPQKNPTAHIPKEDGGFSAELSDALSSHLLCHSDSEGFYVPIDFPKPLIADSDQVAGGILGSSQALQRELVFVAPFLGVKLVEGVLSDAEAERINDLVESEAAFAIELAVWLSLFESARLSIEHRSAICFG